MVDDGFAKTKRWNERLIIPLERALKVALEKCN